jgi:hypothetical protein
MSRCLIAGSTKRVQVQTRTGKLKDDLGFATRTQIKAMGYDFFFSYKRVSDLAYQQKPFDDLSDEVRTAP